MKIELKTTHGTASVRIDGKEIHTTSFTWTDISKYLESNNPQQQAQAGEPEVVAWCVLEPWLSGKFSAEDCFSDVQLDANVGWVPLITLQSHREAMEKLQERLFAKLMIAMADSAKKDAALKACVEALGSAKAVIKGREHTGFIDTATTQAERALK